MFNDVQNEKVRKYAMWYIASSPTPLILDDILGRWDAFFGLLFWMFTSLAYLILYRKITAELPINDRFFVTWGIALGLPQILYKMSWVFSAFSIWFIGIVVFDAL